MKNQQIELELPNDKANIKAAQFGTKSNEIEVQDGDILEITTRKWYRMSIYILMVAFPLTSFIPDLTYRIIALISLFVLSIIGLLVDGFYLKILDREQ